MDSHQAQPRSMRMDYPNPNNVMVDKNRPLVDAQRPPADPRSAYFTPPSAPSYAPPMSPPPQKRQGSMFPLISLVALIILLSAATYGVWRFVIKPNSVANVTLYNVKSEPVPVTLGGSGIIYPQQELDVQYPASLQIAAVSVKAGQKVTNGSPLIKVDLGQISSQIAQANAKLQAAQAYLATLQAGVGTAAQIAAAQQQVANAQSDLTQLQQQAGAIQGGSLNSSISGVVTQVNVNPGETVAANTPLLTVMDESTVVVHAKVPLANLGQVTLNEKATVTASSNANLSMNGVVTSIIPEADPQTDTFEVWVSIPNTNLQLLPGMSAFVAIQSQRTALVVPRLAVLNQDSNPQVFVAGTDGRAHLQSIHVVARTADSIFVDSGIQSGDHVVIVGLDTLVDGQQLHVTSIEG